MDSVSIDPHAKVIMNQINCTDLDEWFENLISRGKQIPATSPAVDISKRPEYFDQKLFKRAQRACQKYYVNLSMASTSGLLLLLQQDCILQPLIKSGKSKTVPDLYDRYTATVKYITCLYDTDFVDPSTRGWRYIIMVRGMHDKIHILMNQDRKGDGNPNLWVNQYDMVVTQMAFMELFILHHEKCGIYDLKPQEKQDIIYYWRIISYYFGIEERFNIFAFHNDMDRQIQLVDKFFRYKNQKKRIGVGLEMAKGFMLAFEELSENSSFNILDHWWYPEVRISGQQESYTWSDLYKLIFFLFYFKILFRFQIFLPLVNRAYRKKFDRFCKDGDKVKKKLRKKYGHLTYE